MLPCHTSQSYVRNEPAFLQPTPSSVQGTVEPLGLTTLSLGAPLSLFPAFVGLHSAPTPPCPDWHLTSVAQGD